MKKNSLKWGIIKQGNKERTKEGEGVEEKRKKGNRRKERGGITPHEKKGEAEERRAGKGT